MPDQVSPTKKLKSTSAYDSILDNVGSFLSEFDMDYDEELRVEGMVTTASEEEYTPTFSTS
ncbi:Hypothetical protein FKW44_022689 [Caligus rogercresseyi]|uniref:Uncharacterized protein n=1 Tax=Caligus rogercresseyi TaxID=217165 RepID=A0A7T8GNF8_CALRO|nr:Hypothetical protein FKW44_022689 [Caligus rogercresseyi]